MTNNHHLISDFLASLGNGQLPANMFTNDLQAYTSSSGDMAGARYLQAPQMLGMLFQDGLKYEVIAIMDGENCAAIEARGNGVFKDGTAYSNDYLFQLKFRDGKICSVAEHFNPKPVQQEIGPRIQAMMAQK